MMYAYPFGGFPNFRRNFYYPPKNYFYYNRPNPLKNNSHNQCSNIKNDSVLDNNYKQKNALPQTCINKQNCEKVDCECEDSCYDTECFEIFGFKIHFDDLLILGLLFLLYKEGSDDMYLYIALFLLLLS